MNGHSGHDFEFGAGRDRSGGGVSSVVQQRCFADVASATAATAGVASQQHQTAAQVMTDRVTQRANLDVTIATTTAF